MEKQEVTGVKQSQNGQLNLDHTQCHLPNCFGVDDQMYEKITQTIMMIGISDTPDRPKWSHLIEDVLNKFPDATFEQKLCIVHTIGEAHAVMQNI